MRTKQPIYNLTLQGFFDLAVLAIILGFCSGIASAQDAQKDALTRQIEATSTERTVMAATAKCPTFTGTVNSGSGIGVSVNWSDGNVASSYKVTRAGITFPYDGTRRVHSEISGCGFAASFQIQASYPDGSSCTISSTGAAPHSAPCTAGNAAGSSAAYSAASYSDLLAPGSITAIFGTNFTSQIASASSLPLPTTLGGVEVYAFFNTPLQRKCGLFFASPGQVNALLPADLPYGGAGTLAVVNLAEDTLRPTWFYLNHYEPGIFTRDENGHGRAAGYLDRGFYVLFGTGFGDASNGFLLSGGNRFQASFVGAAPGFAGLGQVNVAAPLPSGAQVQFCTTVNDESRCSQFFLLP